MLVIKDNQKKAMGETGLDAYKLELVAHLVSWAPALARVTGNARLLVLVSTGVDAARQHGLTTRGPVRLYVELMVFLGHRFVADPQYPWVSAILDDEKLSQARKGDELWQRLSTYIVEAIGPQDDFASGVRRKRRVLTEFPFSTLDSKDFESGLLHAIRRVDSPRALHLGAEALSALMQEGVKQASVWGLYTPPGQGLFVVLCLLFGHGCADDPLLVWLRESLQSSADLPESARIEATKRACFDWFSQLLAADAEVGVQ